MSDHGTTSQEFPAWYITFQIAALKNLPRPGEIDEQIALGWSDNGESMKHVLREVLVPPEQIAGDFAPPPGGRVHVLTIPVSLDKPWNAAVQAAGPSTPGEYDIWKVGDLYLPGPPTGRGAVQTKMVLVNFGSTGGNLAKAIAWAEQYGLKKTNPRQVFAIGEHKPQLNRELGANSMYAVATEECFFEGNRQVCNVWWNDAKRKANLNWTDNVGNANDWFVFACYFLRSPAVEAGVSVSIFRVHPPSPRNYDEYFD
jgi:hypothetical protein